MTKLPPNLSYINIRYKNLKHFCVRHKLPSEFYRAAKKIAEEKDSISILELKILERGFLAGRDFQQNRIRERLVLWAKKTFEEDANDMSKV